MKGNLVDESVLDENIESPNVEKVPLKDEDRNSWLEFKKLAEGMPEVTIINHKTLTTCWEFINVDHPFVSVVRDFATNAFNEVVHMYGRYRKSNSMTHSEVISCKYINMHNNYYFNMTMEAIEEGVLEVYEIIVACDLINGSTTLVKKNSVHSTPPTGKIAMLLHHLSSLKSEYKTWKAEKKDTEIKLGRARKSMKKGTDNQKAATKLINLKKRHKAIKGKCNLLYREIESQIPEGWSKRSDPRDIVSRGWWTKSDTYRTGLIENGWVYNYQVRSMAFPLYALFW
ncbi:uncharacterized protein [Rutidosis leptorrhynchoides]|uniref:uncharacterized protein isoform X2 n=1 Tax=Rutidosis leptorrhynchoides TaxID=125765 RepID=UPI003A99CB21